MLQPKSTFTCSPNKQKILQVWTGTCLSRRLFSYAEVEFHAVQSTSIGLLLIFSLSANSNVTMPGWLSGKNYFPISSMCQLCFWARMSLSWSLMLTYRPSYQLTLSMNFQNILEVLYTHKLLYYFLLLYLKTCLGIIYKFPLIGVFFCFKELIQNDKFKDNQGSDWVWG